MIQLQRLTGMRPGEVCRLRACDLERGEKGNVWFYRPSTHKSEHLGRQRIVAIGPQAQAVIKPWFKLDTQAYLFSPGEAEDRRNAEKRASRRTPMTPFHERRAAAARRRTRQRAPRERYSSESYARAIARACERAFPPSEELARRKVKANRGTDRWETPAEWQARLGPAGWENVKEWQQTHHWAPNQLRHSRLTEVRRHFGLEAAQVAAGHARADVTQVYAERDLALAEKVAAEIG
jgi:integrase